MVTDMSTRTYIFFAVFCFSMGVFVWFFIPETKGSSITLYYIYTLANSLS